MTRVEYNKLKRFIKKYNLEDRFPKHYLAMSRLKLLDLSSTEVEDISVLESLKTLVWINLDNTKVKDISVLSKLPNLRWITMDKTKITDITPLLGKVNLVSIFARDTKLKRRYSRPRVYV